MSQISKLYPQANSLIAQVRWSAVLLMLIGLLGTGYFGTHLQAEPSININSANSIAESASPKHLSESLPVHIRIPSIDLDASVQTVNLGPDKGLEVPSNPSHVGWYNNSPTPGEIGPAIFDGHVDKVGGIAVFWRLRELKSGQIIEVDRQDGTTARFKVTSIKQFPQDNFPTQDVYGNIKFSGIRLITCGGVFNTQTGHYSDNIVVFGHLI